MSKIAQLLDLKHPIIVAPMFLVSNDKMLVAAAESGATACIPSLNYRSSEEFRAGMRSIREKTKGKIGVNLIVNQSNPRAKADLHIALDEGVDYFITSLGNPKEVIEESHKKSKLVFCDVTDLEFAKKVESQGADAVIAVNSGAGGHAGKIPATILIPNLKRHCKIPVISAGGVATGDAMLAMEVMGADAFSIGTPFIASTECGVNEEYKNAIVKYGAKDIVMTSKLSGTPCTVINTDYMKKIGIEQNMLESYLNKNKQFKKYAKMLTFYKGMKLLENAAFSASYKTVWCAGPSLEFTDKVRPMKEIIDSFVQEYNQAKSNLRA